jgi:alanyl aminopeptidase
MRRALSLALVCLACGPASPSARYRPEPKAALASDPAPPPRSDGRLPPGVAPLGYRLELTIDPREKSFIGRARIRVRFERATRAVVLHGRDLQVLTASITSASGKQWAKSRLRQAAISKGEAEELVLSVEREIGAGEGEIDVQYQAPFADGLAGLYRVREGGRDYAFTQFEPTDARRAFPCFDEPSFKVPFEIAITAPSNMRAFANTPLASDSEQRESGLTTYTFEKSAPLPSYLVALAVGELDVLEGPKTPVPIRVVAARGKAGLGKLALEAAAEQLGLLVDYFGEPYPYAKLDLVAVPDFAAGAMENPGLVTFREELLLLDPERASVASRRALASVMAHELAHQWFGNLVTLAWWDDIWLNEGFATWMGTKIVDRHKPAFGAGLEALGGKSRVMAIDALREARKIRQPVRSSSEAIEAFDGITYVKGMSVLGMVEGWVGEDRFQHGIRSYIGAHRHRTATAEDLVAAVSKSSSEDVAAVMDGFLDQTGVPLVDVRLSCPPGGEARLELTQSEYRPLGTSGTAERSWRFPVCVRHDAAKTPPPCTLIGAERAEIPLGKRCPTLIQPNAGDRGYYHYRLGDAELLRLAKSGSKFSTDAERLGLVGNAWALVKSGALGADVYLGMLRHFEREPSRAVWERITSTLEELERALVGDAERPAFAKLVRDICGPMGKKLGASPRAGEPEDQRLLRRTLLGALGRLGDEPWVKIEADRVTRAWLADPASVDGDVAATLVPIAAASGDAELFAALVERSKNAKTPEQRLTAIGGLAGFDRPELVEKLLGLLLEPGALKAQDVRYVIPPLFARHPTRDVAWRFMQKHFAALQKRLPPFVFGRLAWVIASFCDDRAVESAAEFLRPRLKMVEGADKPMRQALEAGKLCAAFARGQRESARKVLGASP